VYGIISWLYILYVVILGRVSWFTGRIVTFVRVRGILIDLKKINPILKKMYLQSNVEK